MNSIRVYDSTLGPFSDMSPVVHDYLAVPGFGALEDVCSERRVKDCSLHIGGPSLLDWILDTVLRF